MDLIERHLAERRIDEALSKVFTNNSGSIGKQILDKIPSAQPEPCEDAVSRTDVFNAIRGEERGGYVDVTVEYMLEVMSNLPSVVPKRKAGNMREPADRWEPKDGTGINVGGITDLVSRRYLLSEYDRQHKGPAGGARKIIEEAPSVVPDINVGGMISRQWVIDELKRYFHDEYYQRTSIQDCINCFIEDILTKLPPTQPEIIRCKDCKWKQGSECVRFAEVRPFPDDFCSRAERRTDE